MTSHDLALKSAQVTFFTRVDLTEKLSVATKLRTALTLFDGEPLVLPAFPDAPPEIPQIVLRNKATTFQCVVTPVRIDLAYVRQPEDQPVPSSPQNSLQTVLDPAPILLSAIHNELSSRVTRLGLVTQFEVQLSEDANDFVRGHFLCTGAPPGDRALELSFLDRIQFASLTLNRWIRVKTNPNQPTSLALVVDLNTLAEEELDLAEEQADQILHLAVDFLHDELPVIVHLA